MDKVLGIGLGISFLLEIIGLIGMFVLSIAERMARRLPFKIVPIATVSGFIMLLGFLGSIVFGLGLTIKVIGSFIS